MNPSQSAPRFGFVSLVVRYFSLGLALLGGATGAAGAAPGQPWENSLGQKFVPVPGTSALVCIWETRVQDFDAFVQATDYPAESGMHSRFAADLTWKPRGDTWRAPGFVQTPLHPVCGVSWEDAQAFCRWLTAKERQEKKLAANQEYRLPTDREWSLAVGLPSEGEGSPKDKSDKIPGVFPWGLQYPPPPGAGNFASEGDDVGWQIAGYTDGAPRTAKVGSYTANALGIYDLGGNLWEWCEDAYEPGSAARVLRGASWINDGPANLLSSHRSFGTPTARHDGRGFRCVLANVAATSAVLSLLPTPVVLKTNGGWCWFQDERAIVVGDTLLFGSIAGSNRVGGAAGDVAVTDVDLRTGRARSTTLHTKLQSDDHNAPALLALPGGRVLATYQTHGGPPGMPGLDLMRWRRTVRPGDYSEWTSEQTLPVGADVSYSNLYRLGAEGGRIYNFHRGLGYNPNYLVSTDDGATFTYGGRLLTWGRSVGEPLATGIDGGRPYMRYAQAGDDTIHIVATDDHPRAFDNSIYHAFLRRGILHHSDGRLIARLSTTGESALAPRSLTTVFQGDADHVAWMCDVHVDPLGHPRILFSVQRGGAKNRGLRAAADDGQDHRYDYARWDGAKWRVNEIAHAGTRLYAGEDDYTGLAALDPQNLNTVYISTNADPKTGAPLISAADQKRHWEIFRGDSPDDGATFTWTPVTRDSTADNLRPIVPIWSTAGDRAIVLWLRGVFRSYTDYDLDVVGLLPAPALAPKK